MTSRQISFDDVKSFASWNETLVPTHCPVSPRPDSSHLDVTITPPQRRKPVVPAPVIRDHGRFPFRKGDRLTCARKLVFPGDTEEDGKTRLDFVFPTPREITDLTGDMPVIDLTAL